MPQAITDVLSMADNLTRIFHQRAPALACSLPLYVSYAQSTVLPALPDKISWSDKVPGFAFALPPTSMWSRARFGAVYEISGLIKISNGNVDELRQSVREIRPKDARTKIPADEMEQRNEEAVETPGLTKDVSLNDVKKPFVPGSNLNCVKLKVIVVFGFQVSIE